MSAKTKKSPLATLAEPFDRHHSQPGVQNTMDKANSAATFAGFGNSFMNELINPKNKASPLSLSSNVQKSPISKNVGSGLGHVGGALATAGLIQDVADLSGDQNVDEQSNSTVSALGNATGVGSWAAGACGAAGASTAAVLSAAGTGLAVGAVGNSFFEDVGWLGKQKNGSNRSLSDAAWDAGSWANEEVAANFGETAGDFAGAFVGAQATGMSVIPAILGTAATLPLAAYRAMTGPSDKKKKPPE